MGNRYDDKSTKQKKRINDKISQCPPDYLVGSVTTGNLIINEVELCLFDELCICQYPDVSHVLRLTGSA